MHIPRRPIAARGAYSPSLQLQWLWQTARGYAPLLYCQLQFPYWTETFQGCSNIASNSICHIPLLTLPMSI